MPGKKDERGRRSRTSQRLGAGQLVAILRSAIRMFHRCRALLSASRLLLTDSRKRLDDGTVPVTVLPACHHPPSASEQQSAIVTAVAICGIELPDLWLCYANLGGDRSRQQLLAFLAGTDEWPTYDCDMLAHALNETLWASGIPSFLEYTGGPGGPATS